MQRGLLTGILLGVAMTIFALQNSVKVQLKLLLWKIDEVPLALILLISILIGVVVTSVFSIIDKQRLKSRIRNLQNKIKDLESGKSADPRDQQAEDLLSDEGMTIDGEPGNHFFED